MISRFVEIMQTAFLVSPMQKLLKIEQLGQQAGSLFPRDKGRGLPFLRLLFFFGYEDGQDACKLRRLYERSTSDLIFSSKILHLKLTRQRSLLVAHKKNISFLHSSANLICDHIRTVTATKVTNLPFQTLISQNCIRTFHNIPRSLKFRKSKRGSRSFT